MSAYLRPSALGDALGALASGGPGGDAWVIVAGATDYYPARVGRPRTEDVLDVTAVRDLHGVTEVDGGWRLGALTTWTELVETPLPPLFDGLKAAALAVGGLQIQARGTVVGNVCNASPAADGMPNLLALDAQVELSSRAAARIVPVGSFVVGNRRTVRRADELVTGLFVPTPLPETTVRSTFEKLGSRAYLVISIAMVAAIAEIGLDGVIRRLRAAAGACSEVAQRLPEIEAAFAGLPARDAAAAVPDLVRPRDLDGLNPIDDVRGSAAYRREAALELVRRAVREVLA